MSGKSRCTRPGIPYWCYSYFFVIMLFNAVSLRSLEVKYDRNFRFLSLDKQQQSITTVLLWAFWGLVFSISWLSYCSLIDHCILRIKMPVRLKFSMVILILMRETISKHFKNQQQNAAVVMNHKVWLYKIVIQYFPCREHVVFQRPYHLLSNFYALSSFFVRTKWFFPGITFRWIIPWWLL